MTKKTIWEFLPQFLRIPPPLAPGLFIKKRLQHRHFPVNFARFFRTSILYTIICVVQNRCSKKSRKIHGKIHMNGLLVLARIDLVKPAANFLVFSRMTVSQYLSYWASLLRFCFQMILDWWIPNQCIKVVNATQMIAQLYLDA